MIYDFLMYDLGCLIFRYWLLFCCGESVYQAELDKGPVRIFGFKIVGLKFCNYRRDAMLASFFVKSLTSKSVVITPYSIELPNGPD